MPLFCREYYFFAKENSRYFKLYSKTRATQKRNNVYLLISFKAQVDPRSMPLGTHALICAKQTTYFQNALWNLRTKCRHNHRLCIVEQLPFHLLRSKFKVQQLSFYLLFNFHFQFTNKSVGSLSLYTLRNWLLNSQFEIENINSQSQKRPDKWVQTETFEPPSPGTS